MKQLHDFIIIGSGASGSVLAHYLTQAGADVLMLEAGKRYSAATFPANEMDANAQLMWNGGMDLSSDAATLFIRGKVVGGGTVINQCLLDPFDAEALDDWRSASGIALFRQQDMARHYAAVESRLSLHQMQRSDWNRNAELYVEGFEKLGLEWAPLRRGQRDCGKGNDCIVCLGGCPRKSKQSMVETFLPTAEKQGLTILAEFEVADLVHGQSFVTVHGHHLGQARSFYGRKVILAAGALGTTQLLLKTQLQKRLPALGQQFHCHPQWMTVGLFDEKVDSHKGAFQAVKSSDPRFRTWGFKLENVFAGPIAMSLLKPGYGFEHQRFMQRYRHMACIEVAVRDQDAGTLSLNNKGRLVIQKKLSDADRQRADRGNRIVQDIFTTLGARDIMTSPMQIALHLMGGCSIGTSASRSVVNEGFQVHGLPNLYIADSSIFPNAPGINPSLTIMALSHRASEVILAQCGVSAAPANAQKPHRQQEQQA